MQILALIEIDEEHQFSQVNELYNRLHGYKAKLVPVPNKKTGLQVSCAFGEKNCLEAEYYADGWNDCLDEITGETG